MQRVTQRASNCAPARRASALGISDEARFRGVFDHAVEGIFQTTPEGQYLAANPALAKIYGYSSPEELQARLADIDRQLYVQPGRRSDFLRLMEEQGSVRDFVSEVYRKDGTRIWISENAAAVRDVRGQVLYYEGFVVDITARRRTEEALIKARSELEDRVIERTAELEEANQNLRAVAEELRTAKEFAERASRAKDEFLSRMSHELRTPLNAILGFAQLLDRPDCTPIQRERTSYILRAGRHLLDLINEVLDIARIESGRVELSLEPVRVGEMLQEAVALLAPLAAERQVALFCNEEKDPVFVLADRQRIKQVLLNLVSNAIKYHRPSGGTVRLAVTTAPNDRYRITVADDGPGIPEGYLERLWIPFDRLGAETGGEEGTGLGLALSKRLVEAMGGFMGVETGVDKGSTFWVQLPKARSPLAELDPAKRRLAEQWNGAQARILYIEDNLSNLRLLEHLLEDYPGLELMSAMQGQVGFDLAREHRPELILLDLHLPDLPGRDLLLKLRAEPTTREIPVIVLSADATPPQIQRLRAAGANDYLTKPINVARFVEVIERHLTALHAVQGHA